MTYVPFFMTGLLAGGVTCIAVQGGLLTMVMANAMKKEDARDDSHASNTFIRPGIILFLFLISKFIAYVTLGFILGLVGSQFIVTPPFVAFGVGLAGVIMIVSALSLISDHPLFRRLAVQPPKFIRSFLWKQGKRSDFLAPILLGAFTIFLPCGTTQSVMISALSAGQPFVSAGIIGAFIVGTMPVFILLAIGLRVMDRLGSHIFRTVAGIGIIIFALWNLNTIPTILGISWSPERLIRPVICQIIYCDDLVPSGGSAVTEMPTSTPVIRILETVYAMDNNIIPAGKDITLTIKNERGGGCIQSVTIPSIKYQEIIPVGSEKIITFRSGNAGDKIVVTCSMGMYKTILEVR